MFQRTAKGPYPRVDAGPGFRDLLKVSFHHLKSGWEHYESWLTGEDAPLWLPANRDFRISRLVVSRFRPSDDYFLGGSLLLSCHVKCKNLMELCRLNIERGHSTDYFIGRVQILEGLDLEDWDVIAFWRKVLRRYWNGWDTVRFTNKKFNRVNDPASPGVRLAFELLRAGLCAATPKTSILLRSGCSLNFSQPLLLAVLNLTRNSFSDGGKYLDPDAAVARGQKMVEEGAHALDIGAESSRPGSRGVSDKIQKERLLPVLKRLRKLRELKRIPISIDTRSAEVARACLSEGADLINDISALRHDRQMAKVIARAKCPIILMHMQGTPQTMQKAPAYRDLMDELDLFFRERIHAAYDTGISPTKVLLDPGIGFGKKLKHNLEILRRLEEFRALGRPLVVGVSRKRFLGTLTGEDIPARRVQASVAAGVLAIAHGASVLRVHDVAEHMQALKVAAALMHRTG